MRLPRAVLPSIFAIPFLLQGTASCQIVTITARGTIYNGGDSGGIFGAAGASLKGESFILVMTFDSLKADMNVQPPQCTPSGCVSQTFGHFAKSPGTATLTIKSREYVFGTALEAGPTPAANIWSTAGKTITKQSNFQTVAFSFAITDHTGRVGIGPGLIKPLESTLDPDWRAPFCETGLAAGKLWNAEFEIHNSRVQANGYLAVDTLSVGYGTDTCGSPLVPHPVVGDIVLYRGPNDRFYTHVAVIAPGGIAKDQVTVIAVISKWGRCGLYLHDPDDSPYGRQWTVWHSDRPGFNGNNNALELDQSSEYYTDKRLHHISKGTPKAALSEKQCVQINNSFCSNWTQSGTRELTSATPLYDCRGFVFDASTANLPVEMVFSTVWSDPIDTIRTDNGYFEVTSAKHTGGKCTQDIK